MTCCCPGGRRSAVIAITAAALMAAMGAMTTSWAATPLYETDEMIELCELGAPDRVTDDPDERARYHQERRRAVYDVYETPLVDLDAALLRYDRVAGLLTLSGFRQYQPRRGAPEIRIRNECILSFVLDEEEVHDLMTQIQMGTAEIRIGYHLAARSDYDAHFCPSDDDGNQRQLEVDLLYAQLVDTESSASEDDEIIDTYHTQRGHQWALRRSTQIVGLAGQSVPEVQISHVQWRPRGQRWQDDIENQSVTERLDEIEEQLRPAVERALYPCYVRALEGNASLQGAMVLEIPRDGETAKPNILMDTLDTSGLRDCVTTQLRATDELIGDWDVQQIDAFKITVLMRRR